MTNDDWRDIVAAAEADYEAEIDRLKKENERLRNENDRLEAENQRLTGGIGYGW